MQIIHQTLGILILHAGILLTTNLTAQNPDPLPPQIDSRTHFVVWSDVNRVSFDEILQWAGQTELGPLLQGVQEPEMVAPAKSLLEKLKAAGAQRVYFVGESMALLVDPSAMGLIIRCDQPERCAGALAANPVLPEQFLKTTEGAVLLGMSAEGLEALAEVEGAPSANLAAALESRRDALGIAVAIPATTMDIFVRSVPDKGDSEYAALRCLTDLKWARASGSPPDSKLKLEALFDQTETAAEFAKQVNSMPESIFGGGEKMEYLAAAQERVMLSSQSARTIAELNKAARASAQRAENLNRLRQLVLAMHVFHDATGALPPAALTDQTGKRLLSWRVLILPYLGWERLYKQFHLDEAWDSPHNLALLEQMPDFYRSAGETRESGVRPGYTRFVAPLTAASIMGKAGRPVRLQDIPDGTSNTILLVQAAASAAVPWTKPEDLVIDLSNPSAGLVTEGQPTLLTAFADASVRAIASNVDPQTLKVYLSQADGAGEESQKSEGKR